jgi:hypothetical protein
MSDNFGIRPLQADDIPAVISLMTESFPRRSRAYFATAFDRLSTREIPGGFERLGYIIDDVGPKGAVLAIPSSHKTPAGEQIFVNVSTWCVAPSHRGPAAKALYAQAAARSDAVNTNLSAAAHTLKTIEKLEFRPWSRGQFLAIGTRRSARTQILTIDQAVVAGLPDYQAGMLKDHAEFGCLTPVIESEGRLLPLVLLRRRVRRCLPVAQLIYCENRDAVLDRAAALFSWLRRRGYPALLLDTNGGQPSLRGRYFPGLAAKYYRGQSPKLDIDHTYSEMIYLGF